MEEKKEEIKEELKDNLVITAWGKRCWVCGEIKSYVTSHHTLPKHLKPYRNFVCPVCKDCHDKINKSDMTGLVAFACKIQKSFEGIQDMVKNMVENLKKKGAE